MATWQHLRSSTAHKRPTTSLADGRIAINTNTASPGLFFKDSAGTGIVKVGPVHVGTTAPNSSPAAGGSSGNYLGEQWLDTSLTPAQLKVWNGSAWVGVVADELPVSKLQDGQSRQLLQTDAAGTGVEWTSNVDVPGTLDVTGATTLDSTLTVPLGSAASPTLRFSGDTNTGIYSPGADQVALSTNGTGRLFVDASGQVSIGTSASDGRLTVGGSQVNGVPALNLSPYGANIATTSDIVLSANGCISAENSISNIVAGAGIFAWYNNAAADNTGTAGATHLMRLDGQGRLSIGTTSSGGTLDIKAATSATPLIVQGPSSEFVRIDSSGRLLIGTSSARSLAGITGVLQLEGTSFSQSTFSIVSNSNDNTGCYVNLGKSRSGSLGGVAAVQNNDLLGAVRFAGADGTSLSSYAATIFAAVDGTPGANDMPGRLVFGTTPGGSATPVERMRIGSNGRFSFNTLGSEPSATVNGTQIHESGYIFCSVNDSTAGFFNRNTSDGSLVGFRRANVTVGSISVTTTATAYNTSSDYRLKENVTPVTDGITRLLQLKPSRFNFIADPDKTVDGFLAHEVQAIVPEAITGEKDAVDDEGNPQYQGIDQSKLVPLLTAALQEAIGEIESLKARVAALESA